MVIEWNLLFFSPSQCLKNKGQGRMVGPAAWTTRGGWGVEGWKVREGPAGAHSSPLMGLAALSCTL